MCNHAIYLQIFLVQHMTENPQTRSLRNQQFSFAYPYSITFKVVDKPLGESIILVGWEGGSKAGGALGGCQKGAFFPEFLPLLTLSQVYNPGYLELVMKRRVKNIEKASQIHLTRLQQDAINLIEIAVAIYAEIK